MLPLAIPLICPSLLYGVLQFRLHFSLTISLTEFLFLIVPIMHRKSDIQKYICCFMITDMLFYLQVLLHFVWLLCLSYILYFRLVITQLCEWTYIINTVRFMQSFMNGLFIIKAFYILGFQAAAAAF